MNIILRPWQSEYMHIIQKLKPGQIINVYGAGNTGKSFMKLYYNRHNINYIEYESDTTDYKKLMDNSKINVIISLKELTDDIISESIEAKHETVNHFNTTGGVYK